MSARSRSAFNAARRDDARRPVCGGCCEVAMFSWMGGAHHCVVADPAEVVEVAPPRLCTPPSAPSESPATPGPPAGLVEYVMRVNRARAPIHRNAIHFTGTGTGHQVEIAAQWNAGSADAVHTFVNSAPTVDGGTHRDGFVAALTAVLNGFARRHRLITADGPDLSTADLTGGLTAVVVVKLTEPRFSDDTERRLVNPEIRAFVADVCEEHLTGWLTTNPDCAKAIVRKAILCHESRTARARLRS